MESEIYAYFALIGTDLSPEEVTEKVGIKPSKTWKIGDLIHSKATIRKKYNGWRVDSQLSKSDDLESHIKSVMEQLQPGWLSLVEVCKHCKVEISCVIYYRSGSIPAIHFDKYIVEKVHQLNAAIDVDFYVLPEETASDEAVAA